MGDNLKKRNDQLQALANTAVGTAEYNQIAEELAHSARYRANYIEKADFLRLSTLYLGYDLSSLSRKLTKNVVNGMRFSFAIQNVFVLTNYSGADPQVEGMVEHANKEVSEACHVTSPTHLIHVLTQQR